MDSRVSKYHSDDEVMEKRVNRNKEKYKDIDDLDLDNLNLANNISVIKTESEDLDISEIQSILKKKYIKPNTAHGEAPYNEPESTELEITKEYKLKDAIDKAYREKIEDYEKDRYKKLRDTEYEILKSINISNNTDRTTSESSSDEGELITSLLKTIDENALRSSQKSDELLGDLFSDSNTDVLDPVIPDSELENTPAKPTLVEELEKTKQLSRKDIVEELEKETSKEETHELSPTNTNTNTFYTGNLAIEDADLEDFKDIEDEIKSNSILIKVLIILLVLVVLIVAVYLLNKYLNLGLF